MDQTINDFIRLQKAMVIEDDQAIAQLLKIHLTQMGFSVDVFHDAEKAREKISGDYALCLLDWMLPTIQGIDFLKQSRSQLTYTKIMMITAKADADSIVSGLDSGADDYLTKPFDAQVLMARVRHLMRRLQYEQSLTGASARAATVGSSAVIGFDGLELDIGKHILKLQGQEVHLTPSEFKLLAELLKAQGQVLTRERLIDQIQGADVTVTGRTIDTHIFALRKKIGAWSKYIETIRGVGYRILISAQDSTEVSES